MKNKTLVFMILVSGMTFTNKVQAQIDNLVNLSPEWIRTGTRNAADNSADAAVYNPAGMSLMKDGFHINIGNQSLFRKPEHEYDLGMGIKHAQQDGADWLLPNLYASYNKNHTSFFTGVYLSGGGATANYPGGSINTDLIAMQALMGAQGAYTDVKNQYLKASSSYLTGIAGFSKSFSDQFSAGITVRYITAKNSTQAGLTLYSSPYELPDAPLAIDMDEAASGAGVMMSINFKPNSDLSFAVRYESRVKLDFKTTQHTDDFGLSTDGSKSRRDLPSVIGFGTEYHVSEKVKAMVDVNWYFQKNADWGTTYVIGEEKNVADLAGDASTYALAFEYQATPKLAVSLGSVYSVYAYGDKDAYFTRAGAFETLIDDNISLNTGISYKLNNMFSVTAGYMGNFWKKDVSVSALNAYPMDLKVKTNNAMSTLALGLNVSF